MAQLAITTDKPAMSSEAAERITGIVRAAIASRGAAAMALTGGGTPDLLYQFLADPDRPWRGRIDWTHVHLFWSDERAVPPDHADSNFGLANRLLIQHVPVPAMQVHRIRGELTPSDAGHVYDTLLRRRRQQRASPLFDVMLLGIGANAHIASIFPDSPLLDPSEGSASLINPQAPLATGVYVPEIAQWRITMTPEALLDSAAIVIIASGASKAEAIAAAVEGPVEIGRYPAQLLRAATDRVEWIIDSAASARLRGAPPA
jgi:6-phosphogluconolactonase